jgi:hypothetical protein
MGGCQSVLPVPKKDIAIIQPNPILSTSMEQQHGETSKTVQEKDSALANLLQN